MSVPSAIPTPCFQIDCFYVNQRTRRRTSEVGSVTRVHCSPLHWMSTWKVWSTTIPFYGYQRSNGYDVHRKTSLLSDISRDSSGLTVAYPKQKKSDALNFYRGFAEQAWNQTGKRISYLRCDNAKEFLSSALNEYLSTQGTVCKTFRTTLLN